MTELVFIYFFVITSQLMPYLNFADMTRQAPGFDVASCGCLCCFHPPLSENLALYRDVHLHMTCSSLLSLTYFYGNTSINVAHVYYHFNERVLVIQFSEGYVLCRQRKTCPHILRNIAMNGNLWKKCPYLHIIVAGKQWQTTGERKERRIMY